MLSEISQAQKDKCWVTALPESPGQPDSWRQKPEWWLPGWGRAMRSCCVMGTEFKLCKIKKVLEIGCTKI